MPKILCLLCCVLLVACEPSLEEKVATFSETLSVDINANLRIEGKDVYGQKFEHKLPIEKAHTIVDLLRENDEGTCYVDIEFTLKEGEKVTAERKSSAIIDYNSGGSSFLKKVFVDNYYNYYINDFATASIDLNLVDAHSFELVLKVFTANAAVAMDKVFFEEKRLVKFDVQAPQQSEFHDKMEDKEAFYKSIIKWWIGEYERFDQRVVDEILFRGNYQFALYQRSGDKRNLAKAAFEHLQYPIIATDRHLHRFHFGTFSIEDENSPYASDDLIIRFSPDSTTVYPLHLTL